MTTSPGSGDGRRRSDAGTAIQFHRDNESALLRSGNTESVIICAEISAFDAPSPLNRGDAAKT
jgi:hypothetical protein